MKQWRPDESIFDECRNLLRVLTQKTENLDRKHQVDPDIAIHIQTMGSTLAALTDLINKLDRQSQTSHVPEIIKDARGFTYQSVRSCDLDRISDK
ncbi:hypothetical protein [Methanoregula sp.]|uniref:hypothetical protein n=1 Tax=Methanoregula sp. TaxID=2052170 RepID=UPI00356A2EE9